MALVSAVEDLLPVIAKRPEPYVLFGLVEASASLCGSSLIFVDAVGVAGCLDECDSHDVVLDLMSRRSNPAAGDEIPIARKCGVDPLRREAVIF